MDRYVGKQRSSKLDTLMLPKCSTLVFKFDSALLFRFLEIMTVMSTLSQEERKIVDDLDIAVMAQTLSNNFTKSLLMDINSKSGSDLVSMRMSLRHSLQLIYNSSFAASVNMPL